MDTILAMKSPGQVRVVCKKFTDGPGLAVDTHTRPIHKIGLQAPTAPNDPCVRGGLINNRLPFRFQQVKVPAAHPIHVVQQHEARNLFRASLKKALNRTGDDIHSVN
jgi:hypothetical protein